MSRAARWFLGFQALGLLAILVYLLFKQLVFGIGSARMALVALLPGSLLGGRLIEWLLWPKPVSRETIRILATVAAVGINALAWGAFAACRVLWARREAQNGAA